MVQPMEVESVKEERRDKQRINGAASLTAMPSWLAAHLIGTLMLAWKLTELAAVDPAACSISSTAVDSSTQLSITTV